jgi:hypothetical protein
MNQSIIAKRLFFQTIHGVSTCINNANAHLYIQTESRKTEISSSNSQLTISMSNAVGSVIIAAAQSVAKVYVIGGIGYAAVLCT